MSSVLSLPLPKEINAAFLEFNTYISPEEELIIFSSFGRLDGLDQDDLYISRTDSSGQWMAARNLGWTDQFHHTNRIIV